MTPDKENLRLQILQQISSLLTKHHLNNADAERLANLSKAYRNLGESNSYV